ncbi:hypothetical protein JQC67_00760 [Aurantibacter crassamenti]|nr:hypothetical protein [Aurantibacter crassamenti]MBM1104655.1 hypothetical protein [Aurantibacter crassamenti]
MIYVLFGVDFVDFITMDNALIANINCFGGFIWEVYNLGEALKVVYGYM